MTAPRNDMMQSEDVTKFMRDRTSRFLIPGLLVHVATHVVRVVLERVGNSIQNHRLLPDIGVKRGPTTRFGQEASKDRFVRQVRAAVESVAGRAFTFGAFRVAPGGAVDVHIVDLVDRKGFRRARGAQDLKT